MKLRLHVDGTEGGAFEDVVEGRIATNVGLAMHWGSGGSREWGKLCPVQNLDAIETELALVEGEFLRIAQEAAAATAANTEHPDAAYGHELLHKRLELHAWRRCLHVSRRLNEAVRPDLALAERFVTAVLRMQHLMRRAQVESQGFIMCAGIQLRAETAGKLMQLLAARAAEQTSA